MRKAVYKGKIRDRRTNQVDMFYEYRGREYIVTDTHNGYGFDDEIARQHKYEQERIDREIESKSKPIETGTFDIDKVFELLGW